MHLPQRSATAAPPIQQVAPAVTSAAAPVVADPLSDLQREVHELRLAVASLRADIARLSEPPVAPVVSSTDELGASDVAPEPATVTLWLPLARAALAAGVPADAVIPLDQGPDTAPTEIVLADEESQRPEPVGPLPEAPLLDPRLARVAAALDEMLGEPAPERETAAAQRESA